MGWRTGQGRGTRPRVVVALIGLAALCSCTSPKGNAVAAAPTTTAAPTTAAPPPTFPLTGVLTGGAGLARPALSVKVDNVQDARPQSGLNDADVVYEELVEGGLTRLFAVFQSHDTAVVGPIRSARPVDADLLAALNGGLFAYSGAAPGEIAPVEDHSGATLLSHDAGVGAFYRDTSRRAPHNVYASTPDLYAAGVEAGDGSSPPPALFRYGAPAAGTPVAEAALTMGERSANVWRWNAATGQFDREQDGTPDVLDDGSQVSATNVLVMSVQIQGTGIFDVVGDEDPLVVVIGEGPCWLLTGGQVVAGHWSRPAVGAPTTFTDASGRPLLLAPGRTWVELQQAAYQPAFS